MKRNEIIIRDPFLLQVDGVYYLYGTRSETAWTDADGFDVYVSEDLEEWSGPKEIFHKPEGFWATKKYWAPECVEYNNAYYFIATLASEERNSGIQILKSDMPEGPFVPITDVPITPVEWNALDGTVYFEDADTPWLIFSHSMPEEPRGAMCAMRLTKEMQPADEEIHTLFFAKGAPWAKPIPFAKAEFGIDGDAYFTDGPYVFYEDDKVMNMLWSSWGNGGYTMGIAVSPSGNILGPWEHTEKTLAADGGHGMVFTGADGERLLVYHSPNESGKEHPVFEKF